MMKIILFVYVLVLSTFSIVAQNTPPIVSNFRINNDQKNRIYFDSSEYLEGTNVKGFYINGKSVVGIHINKKKKTDHYFTISKSFDYWDHNMIRYEGGSNIKDEQGNKLTKFSLSYIKNELPEPSSKGRILYVSTKGKDGNKGLSEKTAWRTISYATKQVKPGDIVYIKSGNYGSERVIISKGGTSSNPVKFIGYRNKVGDIKTMYYNYGDGALDSNKMPMLNGGNDKGIGISVSRSASNIIIKNLQISNYEYGINAKGHRQVYENVLVTSCGEFGIHLRGEKNSYYKVLNSTIINAGNSLIRVFYNFNLIDNCKVYGDDNSSYGANADYYYSFYAGSNNIIRNSYLHRDKKLTHTGHGISFKGGSERTEYNLAENCEIYGTRQSVEFRHSSVKYSVARNIRITGYKENTGGVVFRDGATYNTAENFEISGVDIAISYGDSKTEDGGRQIAGNYNLVKNFLVYDVNIGIMARTGLSASHNQILNSTFHNINSFTDIQIPFNNTNEFINNIISETGKYHKGKTPGAIFKNNNYYKNGFKASLNNENMSKDPKFENSQKGNFKLKNDSPLIDKGKDIDEIELDFDGNPRRNGKIDIGAFEYQNKEESAFEANAGEDQVICLGEEVSLTGTGGLKYTWNTGQTDQTIKVSPIETTTYTVTVSDGKTEDTDEVTVTVNQVEVDAGKDVIISQGSSVKLSASVGDSYKWSTGETTQSIEVNPEDTNTYTVEVKIGSCSSTDAVKVTVKREDGKVVVADAGEDQRICLGESVTLVASGGLTYSWSNGASTASIVVSPTETTNYSVIVSDGISEATDKVVVSVDNVVAHAGSDVTILQGSSVKLSASGGERYKWSTGETTQSIIATPDKTQTYSVLVSTGDCQDTDEVSVEVKTIVNDLPGPDADAGEDQTICLGQSLLLTGQGGEIYKWSTEEEKEAITVSPTRTTTYSLEVTKNGKSDSDTVTITVENCQKDNSETDELLTDGDIQVYPNPTKGTINVDINQYENDLDVHVINITGSILLHEKVPSHQKKITTQFDISYFTKGIYFVRFSNANENYVKKVVLI